MVIYNARIVTLEGEDIPDGYIGFDDGKIALIGTMADAPRLIDGDYDARGGTVYPGFIDAHSHVGFCADGSGLSYADLNERTDPVTPQLRAIDGVNPLEKCFLEAAGAGVTAVVTGMGSANAIGGQMMTMKTKGVRRTADALVVKAPCAIKMAFGENPKRVYGTKEKTPETRMATAALIREALRKAQYVVNNPDLSENKYPDVKTRALIALLKREIPAHIHCHRADDILTAVRIAAEFNLDYTLIHATEGYLIAEELAKAGAACVIGPVISDRSKPELARSTVENAALLQKAGVPVAICTDHFEVPIQYLPLSAGIAISAGLPERQALLAITKNAAVIAGIGDRAGSLAPGKDADMVLFAKGVRFFDVTAKPELVVIDGVIAASGKL